MSATDTIVALSTPPGESALAVVRASGPACTELSRAILGRKAPPPWRYATLGNYYDLSGGLLDTGVLVLYEPGKSFTGEAMLEFTCHGNPLLVEQILRDLVSRGCRLAEPGEFSRTAFLNGRMDLSQAEAVIDLIQAKSELAMVFARKQMQGSIGKLVGDLSESLLGILARLEAYIDFPEEDLPHENQEGPTSDLVALIGRLEMTLQNSKYKALLDNGIQTLIVGPTNAGKSSLLNLLMGEDRALVSPEPGTTRDYIRESFSLDKHRIQIMDTAGLRSEAGDLEAEGIQKTLNLMDRADFFLLVLDGPLPFPSLPSAALDKLTPDNTLILQNKMDLGDPQQLPSIFEAFSVCRLSVETGQGYSDFRSTWKAKLDARLFTPPSDSVVLNARHADAMTLALDSLRQAHLKLTERQETILVCSNLRVALGALGEVIGKVDNEAMLDILFKEFCIGK